jgi:hypothetical protein
LAETEKNEQGTMVRGKEGKSRKKSSIGRTKRKATVSTANGGVSAKSVFHT